MKILSNIKQYFKTNFTNNVKPLLETKLGTGAVGLILGSVLLYSIGVFQLEGSALEPTSNILPSLTLLTANSILGTGMAALACFLTLAAFPKKSAMNIEETSDKKMFCISSLMLIVSIFYSINLDNYFLIYLNTILQMISAIAIAVSLKSVMDSTIQLENNINSFLTNGVTYNTVSNTSNHLILANHDKEELEVEQELGLTSYFKK